MISSKVKSVVPGISYRVSPCFMAETIIKLSTGLSELHPHPYSNMVYKLSGDMVYFN